MRYKCTCDECNGTRLDQKDATYECDSCSGRGYFYEVEESVAWSTSEMNQIERDYWRSVL